MPPHFFYGHVRIIYDTAVRAHSEKRTARSVHGIGTWTRSSDALACREEFAFTADEQRTWYEEYGFWVDSLPRHCLAWRRELRDMKAIRKEYDQSIAQVLREGDLKSRKRLAEVIDRLYELGSELPPRTTKTVAGSRTTFRGPMLGRSWP
jgi:hypothetical protein